MRTFAVWTKNVTGYIFEIVQKVDGVSERRK